MLFLSIGTFLTCSLVVVSEEEEVVDKLAGLDELRTLFINLISPLKTCTMEQLVNWLYTKMLSAKSAQVARRKSETESNQATWESLFIYITLLNVMCR